MLPGCLRTLTELAMAYCVDGTISGARACGTAELRGGKSVMPEIHASMVTSFMHSPIRQVRMPTMNLAVRMHRLPGRQQG